VRAQRLVNPETPPANPPQEEAAPPHGTTGGWVAVSRTGVADPKPDAFFSRGEDTWKWTMLVSMPSWITEEMIDDAKQTALAKKKLPAISQLRHLTPHEGPSAQVLHIGSYDDEPP
jgi:hypothetical protein